MIFQQRSNSFHHANEASTITTTTTTCACVVQPESYQVEGQLPDDESETNILFIVIVPGCCCISDTDAAFAVKFPQGGFVAGYPVLSSPWRSN